MKIIFDQPNYNQKMPIFLSDSYLKTESNEYGWISGYIDDILICILPYFIYSKFMFRLLRFTNDVYFLDFNQKKEYEQKFLDEVVKSVKSLNVDMIMQPTSNVVFDKFPKDSVHAPFGSYQIDLTQDEENIWKNLHSKHRNVIRNAEKKGIKVFEDEYDLNKVYQLVSDTFKRSSKNFISKEKFENQIKNLGKNVKVFVAKTEDGVLQGCAVILYSDYSGYYSHGGSVTKPLTGAMNYLQWKVMLSLKTSGVNQYDFVGARINPEKGSKLEGIQKFKKRFGANLHQGYMWKYSVNPLKVKIFELIYKLIKSSKGDIIDQERRKFNA